MSKEERIEARALEMMRNDPRLEYDAAKLKAKWEWNAENDPPERLPGFTRVYHSPNPPAPTNLEVESGSSTFEFAEPPALPQAGSPRFSKGEQVSAEQIREWINNGQVHFAEGVSYICPLVEDETPALKNPFEPGTERYAERQAMLEETGLDQGGDSWEPPAYVAGGDTLGLYPPPDTTLNVPPGMSPEEFEKQLIDYCVEKVKDKPPASAKPKFTLTLEDGFTINMPESISRINVEGNRLRIIAQSGNEYLLTGDRPENYELHLFKKGEPTEPEGE